MNLLLRKLSKVINQIERLYRRCSVQTLCVKGENKHLKLARMHRSDTVHAHRLGIILLKGGEASDQ